MDMFFISVKKYRRKLERKPHFLSKNAAALLIAGYTVQLYNMGVNSIGMV